MHNFFTIFYLITFVAFFLANCSQKQETEQMDKDTKEKSVIDNSSKSKNEQFDQPKNENSNREKNNHISNEKNNNNLITKNEIKNEIKKENNTKNETKKEENKKNIKEEDTKIIPPTKKYDKILPYYNDRAVVIIDKKYGLIDKKGNEIIAPKYDYLDGFEYDDITRVRIRDKVGYIDKDGNEIIPMTFRYIDRFDKGLARVQLIDGESFYINRQGQKVCDVLDKYYEGLARIKVGKNIGYVNEQGLIVIKPEYSYGTNFHNGVAEVKKDDHIITINKKGECIKDCK
jgi:hypothetical protein